MTAGTVVITGGILATVILLCIIAVLCYCRLQVRLFCSSLLENWIVCILIHKGSSPKNGNLLLIHSPSSH